MLINIQDITNGYLVQMGDPGSVVRVSAPDIPTVGALLLTALYPSPGPQTATALAAAKTALAAVVTAVAADAAALAPPDAPSTPTTGASS